MGKNIVYIVLALTLISCSNKNSSKNEDRRLPTANTGQKPNKVSIDTFHFFQDCKFMKQNRYIGGIQDTSADRDSSGYMAFYPCYTCKDTYEIIFAYKGGKQDRRDQGYDGIRKDFDGGCADDFAKFECFTFVVPMKDPEKQPDMHALNMDFPATVKIYKRISGNNWRFLESRQIKTFNDYAAMQLAYVYHKWD